jgi:hypothetical protein
MLQISFEPNPTDINGNSNMTINSVSKHCTFIALDMNELKWNSQNPDDQDTYLKLSAEFVI